MDDHTLALQYAQTGNLMDLCHNEAWLRESAQIENETGGQVEAGLPMKGYSQTVSSLKNEQAQDLRQQMIVQSILFTALRQWMESWDLGAGFDDTYQIARRLIRHHLADLPSQQQLAIEALVADGDGTTRMNQSKVEQAKIILLEIFTQEDWQVMADAASRSISTRVWGARQVQPEITVASRRF